MSVTRGSGASLYFASGPTDEVSPISGISGVILSFLYRSFLFAVIGYRRFLFCFETLIL